MEIGEFLALARKGKVSLPYINLATLSKKSGVHASQINRIERGQNRPTVFSLVKICHALQIDLPNLLSAIDRAHEAGKLYETRISDRTESQLTSKDIADFLKKFAKEKIRVDALKDLTSPIVKISENKDADYETFWQYPPDVRLDQIMQVYESGGAINLFDFGRTLHCIREEKSYSLYKVNEEFKFDYESLQAIEDGKNTRLVFDDILHLDTAFETNGKLVAVCWSAARLYTGIIESDSQLYKVEKWSSEEIRYSNYLVNLARWHQSQGMPANAYQNWLRIVRDMMKTG